MSDREALAYQARHLHESLAQAADWMGTPWLVLLAIHR